MIGTQAALCQNGVFDLVEADSKNTPLTQTNYLRNFSCSSDISRGVTVMEFDRSFSEVGDSVVDFSSPYYLVAALGDSPNFEQHISKAYTYVPTMTTSTKSPTIAAPPTSSPTEPPTLAQTSAPTIKQTKTSLFGANSPIKADVETISSSSVKFTVTCPTKNWCAIGMNKKEAKMAGMEAIICANGLVDVYEATGHSTPKLAPQDYVISSCLQNSTTTVMTFTRPLTLKSDLANPNTVNLSSSDSNYFLAAQGLITACLDQSTMLRAITIQVKKDQVQELLQESLFHFSWWRFLVVLTITENRNRKGKIIRQLQLLLQQTTLQFNCD
jgi:hypothetical protein